MDGVWDLPDVEILMNDNIEKYVGNVSKALQRTKEFYQQENILNMQEQLLH